MTPHFESGSEHHDPLHHREPSQSTDHSGSNLLNDNETWMPRSPPENQLLEINHKHHWIYFVYRPDQRQGEYSQQTGFPQSLWSPEWPDQFQNQQYPAHKEAS